MTSHPVARLAARFDHVVMDKRTCRSLETSCPIAEELFSLLEFHSEVEDGGRQFLQKRSGCSAAEAAAIHPKFQAFIRQAKTFFVPAETLHHRARPLFYYYAFLNLAKALLCAYRPALFLSSDKFGHGLRESHKGGDFRDEGALVANDGVFCELYHTLKGKRIAAGTELCIGEMLGRIRDVAYDPGAGGSIASLAAGRSRRIFDNDCRTFWLLLAVSDFKRLCNSYGPAFGDLMNYFEEVSLDWRSEERLFNIVATASPDFAYLQSKKVYSNDEKGLDEFATDMEPLCTKYFAATVHLEEYDFVLSPPLGPNHEYPWDEFLAGYVGYFYLGSLVRYHPAYLESLLKTRAAWTLESFTKSSAETLLRHVVSLIMGEIIKLRRR
jgi:hypothetical protein